ncbi:MAG: porphobilinogen deaminase [Chloroflexi bacterium]|nr:porphobilinogen deaminase [Chloroflexota bacterium]
MDITSEQRAPGGSSASIRVLRLGTRGSALATRQTQLVAELLAARHPGLACEATIIASLGDQVTDKPLSQLGAQGIFTQALERALFEGTVDAAVHSAKDLPSTVADGMVLAAFPVRENPLDCLVSRDGLTLDLLPKGATIGTGSPRRATQLVAARPDIHMMSIRGNVDTRRRAALNGTVDAVILAAAGLSRLGLLDEHAVPLSIDVCLPQAGQGALAIEARSTDLEVIELLRAIDDPRTRACVEAERAVLAGLAAGCQAPVAAFAEIMGDNQVRLRAIVSTDPEHAIRAEEVGPIDLAAHLGYMVARRLDALGAGELLRAAKSGQF